MVPVDTVRLLYCTVICIILHLGISNFIAQSSAHFVKVFKSFCNILWSSLPHPPYMSACGVGLASKNYLKWWAI